jgi:hypothetical protein
VSLPPPRPPTARPGPGGCTESTNDPGDPDFHERQQKYDDAELEMLVLMRESLSIPVI